VPTAVAASSTAAKVETPPAAGGAGDDWESF
jgi:hypothetical protein